ncbi:plant virulence effector HPE1-like domain-containing protein [Agrobacterium vitis]|uniref:plant virulence effector HPE1-like domain-containing protein n=1 Tax=Agrobacterium vitis TaxID=373 RepID=UPI003D2B057D
MRVVIATLATLLLSQTAQASSIEIIGGGDVATPSISAMSCSACPPRAPIKAPEQAQEILAEGTQRIELRDNNGHKQLLRTEAWLGGSPVTFVQKADGWLDHDNQLVGLAGDGLDTATTTAAVGDDHRPLDAASMQLRLK